MNPMIKSVSLGGASLANDPSSPTNYYEHAWNREFVLSSHTNYVKIWISWNEIQGKDGPFPNASALWNHMDTKLTAPKYGGTQISWVDKAVRRANLDGVGVLLCVADAYPPWSNGTSRFPRDDEGRREGGTATGKLGNKRVPTALTAGDPWGWFISYLLCKYQYRNDGKPYINALEIVNEPNFGWNDGAEYRIPTMIQTAHNASNFWGYYAGRPGTPILAPGTADVLASSFANYTNVITAILQNWWPAVYVAWSHHNYKDITLDPKSPSNAPSSANIENVRAHLRGRNYAGGHCNVWLTEGGWHLGGHHGPQQPAWEQIQDGQMRAWYNRMRAAPDVLMSTQHMIQDGNGYTWGMRDPFNYGTGQPGRPRTLHASWGNPAVMRGYYD